MDLIEKDRLSHYTVAMKNIDMNEPMSFTIRNDYAFKKIFGSEENKDILTEFLCLVTDLNKADFENLQIENTELQQKHYDSKAGRLDVKILLKNGQKVDIEMQSAQQNILILLCLRVFGYSQKHRYRLNQPPSVAVLKRRYPDVRYQ